MKAVSGVSLTLESTLDSKDGGEIKDRASGSWFRSLVLNGNEKTLEIPPLKKVNRLGIEDQGITGRIWVCFIRSLIVAPAPAVAARRSQRMTNGFPVSARVAVMMCHSDMIFWYSYNTQLDYFDYSCIQYPAWSKHRNVHIKVSCNLYKASSQIIPSSQ